MKKCIILLIIGLITITSGCIHFPGNNSGEEVERFTEFYLYGPEKSPENYPTDFNTSAPQFVYIGINNEEGKDITYSIEISLSNTSIGTNVEDLENISISSSSHPVFSLMVNDGERDEIPCTFQVEEAGEFFLYFRLIKDDKVYRELKLMINVL